MGRHPAGGRSTAAGGERLGWRTHFDLAGTVGTDDDFPTAHRRAGGGTGR